MRKIILITLAVFWVNATFCQNRFDNYDPKAWKRGYFGQPCDTLVDSVVFAKLIIEKSDRIKRELLNISVDEWILITKLHNTLGVEGLFSDIYSDFNDLFTTNIAYVIHVLDGKPAKGSTYYSSTYNVDIGGSPPYPTSYFCIIRPGWNPIKK